MPKKGHRAASRQAQLRRRKRRGGPRTEEFAAGPTAPPAVEVDESDDEAIPALQPVATAVEPTPRTPRRVRPGASTVTVDASSYLGGELRQAAMITVLIGVILAVLTVLLG